MIPFPKGRSSETNSRRTGSNRNGPRNSRDVPRRRPKLHRRPTKRRGINVLAVLRKQLDRIRRQHLPNPARRSRHQHSRVRHRRHLARSHYQLGAIRTLPRHHRRSNVKTAIATTATAAALFAAGSAHADPASNAVCRLLAAGNTPSGLENSVTVKQVLGKDATRSDARVYIRTIVASQCPQYLWRF